MPQRYKLTMAYDGTAFHGWQKQQPPDAPQLRTVQGVVEQSMVRMFGQHIDLIGASRTDAGVHALGQVAHFDAETTIPIERLAMAINSRLPDDIDVRNVELADATFDAISDAKNKQYRYRIFNAEQRPLLGRHIAWHCWTPLNTAAMQDAARRLIGEHDFAGFAAADHGRASTVRTVFECRVDLEPPQVQVVIEGSGFLYNMVRIIAGTLVDVGRGRFKPAIIDQVLASGKRSESGPTLPPHGLCLEWIKYD